METKRWGLAAGAVSGALFFSLVAGACLVDDPVPAPHPLVRQGYRYFRGLQENVLVHKSLGAMVGVREDGQIQQIQDIVDEDEARWRALHGSIAQPFHEKLIAHQANMAVPFFVLFEPDLDWEPVLEGTWSSDQSEQATSSEMLADAIATKAQQIRSKLEEEGVSVELVGETMPFIAASAPPGLIFKVAMFDDITYLDDAQAGKVVENSTVDPVPFHGVGSTGAFPSQSGTGQKAAVIDPGTCRINNSHVLFQGKQVTHRTPGSTCISSSQCVSSCSSSGSTCSGTFCYDEHATGVMNILYRHAPGAALYFPNTGTASAPSSPACSSGIVGAYDWLVGTSGVRWVNESYECEDITQVNKLDGIAEDYHSRVNDVFVAKSAANNPSQDGDACPSQWNSICVGGVRASKSMSCFSSSRNPGNFDFTTSWQLDREEPDLVAYAGNSNMGPGCAGQTVDNMTAATTSNNISPALVAGNSYASPAILGMAMVFKEYCTSQGSSMNSVLLRSVFRNAAVAYNPDGWYYSTLNSAPLANGRFEPTLDHKDGGGLIDGWTLKPYCTPGDSTHTAEPIRINPQTNGTLGGLPANCNPQFANVPPGGQSLKQPQNQQLDCNTAGSSVKWMNLWANRPGGVIHLESGMRIRATFSWDACVLNSNPAVGTTQVNDYDLFLYNATTGQGYYASQTNDDVNEGFDVAIEDGWAGDYQLLLVWPNGMIGCAGGIDRAGLAVAIYTP